jgi:propionyl-CoA carboxylase alpha chain
MSKIITRLLVANRGEIARRIIHTAHRMGIGTVAVFADGDAHAPFVSEADQAIALGGRSSTETYLDGEKLLAVARRSGADAVHPGYGFLAENADFARAVTGAGLTWVGPTSEAIAAMGDKLAAKRLMESVNLPTLPAVELPPGQDTREAAAEIGFPVLVKAVAGGGGRGMRVVESAEALQDAIDSARREAAASFGDDSLFLERWLAAARHVEIQLLGDLHGNLVHCFERECSIQRRHQKILEEAPSPAVGPELRARMGEAAVAAGNAIGYSSAGTVEFLLDGDDFWFLEVNTRLQVEHPVTEEIIGLDLVRAQLRIAQGEPLDFGQEDLSITGHAIEARLYAEDPDNHFLPTSGRLLSWQPSTSSGARFDTGVETGSEIGIEFDPLLAKIIVHAPTRREAAGRLARVLETTRVQGLTTNRDFLVAVLRNPAFLAGDTKTDFIERVSPARRRIPTPGELAEAGLIVAMVAQHQRRASAKVLTTVPSGWRNTVMPPEEAVFRSDGSEGEEIRVAYRVQRDGHFWAQTGEGEHEVRVHACTGDAIELTIDGRRISATVTCEGDRRLCHGPSGDVELIELPRFPTRSGEMVAGGLAAPMPGTVVSAHVAVGDSVEAGQLLIVLEAMKMEHRITAPHAGVVSELPVGEGDQVVNGQLLVVLSKEAN